MTCKTRRTSKGGKTRKAHEARRTRKARKVRRQWWTNFYLGSRLFKSKIARLMWHAKNGCLKAKFTFDRNTTRNIALCSLLPK